MKSKTSVVVGIVLLILAGTFIAFAMSHPELSFPWSQRVTYMAYGAYIWFVFKFLVGIPVFRKVNPAMVICYFVIDCKVSDITAAEKVTE